MPDCPFEQTCSTCQPHDAGTSNVRWGHKFSMHRNSRCPTFDQSPIVSTDCAKTMFVLGREVGCIKRVFLASMNERVFDSVRSRCTHSPVRECCTQGWRLPPFVCSEQWWSQARIIPAICRSRLIQKGWLAAQWSFRLWITYRGLSFVLTQQLITLPRSWLGPVLFNLQAFLVLPFLEQRKWSNIRLSVLWKRKKWKTFTCVYTLWQRPHTQPVLSL